MRDFLPDYFGATTSPNGNSLSIARSEYNAAGGMGSAEAFLRAKNYALQTLIVLVCRGLQDDKGNQLLDVRAYPWTTLASAQLKPNDAAEYGKEIERRWDKLENNNSEFGAAKPPRPKAWKLDKILEWLDSHPITTPADVEFFQATVQVRKRHWRMLRWNVMQPPSTMTRDEWEIGRENIHTYNQFMFGCLVDHDDIKRAYLWRNDVPQGRLHIDKRNSLDKRDKLSGNCCPTQHLLQSLSSSQMSIRISLVVR